MSKEYSVRVKLKTADKTSHTRSNIFINQHRDMPYGCSNSSYLRSSLLQSDDFDFIAGRRERGIFPFIVSSML